MDKCLSGKLETTMCDAGGNLAPGASANKSPISKIISAHKQIETAGDREAFLGHSGKQINHLFSYAV